MLEIFYWFSFLVLLFLWLKWSHDCYCTSWYYYCWWDLWQHCCWQRERNLSLKNLMQNLGGYKICKTITPIYFNVIWLQMQHFSALEFFVKKGCKPILKLLQLLQREWLQSVELQREEMDCFQRERLQSSWKLQREIEIAFKESGGSPHESPELQENRCLFVYSFLPFLCFQTSSTRLWPISSTLARALSSMIRFYTFSVYTTK